ncbi:hypothetical protein GCM10018787_51590 [Streptomyces thermodiastaticus]|nr:hypothetical protein GCM10018787_51590 [Streptomyces thermodiastaticus]
MRSRGNGAQGERGSENGDPGAGTREQSPGNRGRQALGNRRPDLRNSTFR